MIDFNKTQKAFENYVNNFDINNGMINLKIIFKH